MNITVTFNNLDEVKMFAAMFAGQPGENKAPESVIPQGAAAPTAASQYAVPVTQTAPTAPIQPVASAARTVPVQSAVPTAPVPSAPSTAPTVPVQQAVPTSTRTYTPDELAKAAMPLMDSGRQNELLTLLQQFGTSSIQTLHPSQYGAFATALRGMGAQI